METELLPSGAEERARRLLKLRDVEREPRALPIRNDWLWRAEHFAPRVPYSGTFVLPLGYKPDFPAVAGAVAALIARHEALHSKLTLENDIPLLLPAQPDIDFGRASVPKSEIAAQRDGRPAPTLSAFFTTSIELYEQGGFRAKAFVDEDDQAHLAIQMHH